MCRGSHALNGSVAYVAANEMIELSGLGSVRQIVFARILSLQLETRAIVVPWSGRQRKYMD